ncbi:MAG: DUF1569 domain-containing protein [Rubripirellula sp.]
MAAPKPRQRELKFNSIEEIATEVERLAAMPIETTGQYSYGQILEHLSRVLDVVTGQMPSPTVGLPMRMFARLIRPMLLRKMSPGFKLPSDAQAIFWPDNEVDTQAGLSHFREAIDQFRNADTLPPHPFFGPMTRAKHEQLQCRHCELHLSLVHPAA